LGGVKIYSITINGRLSEELPTLQGAMRSGGRNP
jgi:hypothetical protein